MDFFSNRPHYQLFMFFILFSLFRCSSGEIKTSILKNGLNIKANIHSRFIHSDSIFCDSIEIIELSNSSYQPHLRVGGIEQPKINVRGFEIDKYLEGWFLLNNDSIALVYYSEHKYLIRIKTKLDTPALVKTLAKIEKPIHPESRNKFMVLVGTNDPVKVIEKMKSNWCLDN